MLVASQGIAMPIEANHSEEQNNTLFTTPPAPTWNDADRPAWGGPDRLPEGALIEISGPEARAQAARILSENRKVPAAWIEEKLNPLPQEVLRTPLNFDRVLFIDGGRDSTWAASSLLASGHFPLLVLYAPYEDEAFLRRLRRQARSKRATVLLLREDPCFSWTIRVQLHAVHGRLEVLRWRAQ